MNNKFYKSNLDSKFSFKPEKSLSTSKELKEDAILNGIAQSAREVKEGNTCPLDTLWDQL